MERKSIVIDIPDGMCIDESNSTFERIVFKKKHTYPKSWEEFCANNKTINEEYFINVDSSIVAMCNINYRDRRDCNKDRNVCKTKEEAEAFLALIQLKRLWHEYVDNYSEKVKDCYCIVFVRGKNGNDFSILNIGSSIYDIDLFKFPSKELAEEFLNNFKDLFIKASSLWS